MPLFSFHLYAGSFCLIVRAPTLQFRNQIKVSFYSEEPLASFFMTCVKGDVSQNKYPLAISKLQLGFNWLVFRECLLCFKMQFFNAHMGYISSFYRLISLNSAA